MNPFEISFGKEPREYISREEEIEKITDAFDEGLSRCYLITGIRGSGKTVTLSHISDIYRNKDEWIVVDINPEKDIISSLVAKLYSQANLGHLFIKKDFSIGIYGINLTLSNGQNIVDPENALEIMLGELKKQNKKLLVTIDEATNNKELRVFAHTFQSLIRVDAPVYLLMTGLPENVFSLQNQDTLTFLYRAPKIVLAQLSSAKVFNGYMKVFSDGDLARRMTLMVKGYAYAYQLLGSAVYESGINKITEEIEQEYDRRLADMSYSKIWSELNEMDKKILKAISSTDHSTSQILEELGITKQKFSVYRDRLKQKGYLDTSVHGMLDIVLPRFDKFIEVYDF